MSEGRMIQHRKHKRRRLDKPPVSARLVLDEHVKGDIGIFSEDLLAELSPCTTEDPNVSNGSSEIAKFYHLAISPWSHSKSVEDATWTTVTVRPSNSLAHSTISFSPSSSALQLFAETVQRVAPSELLGQSRSGIDIRVVDVVPLHLDTVFVTIESEQAQRLENGEGTFHGDHPRSTGYQNQNNKISSLGSEDRLTFALREALGSLMILHTGDLFALPLPPHPVTHTPPPPAKITLCEPVSQGVLTPHSKIIITQVGLHSRSSKKQPPLSFQAPLNGVVENDDDTSNDQFYSAAEERDETENGTEEHQFAIDTETETEDDVSSTDALSDDSMDDLISLQAPILPAHNASGISTVQPGTPQTIRPNFNANGIKTPGSVFSNFTATASGQKGRLFKAQGLIRPLSADVLHPRPTVDDDEEARVYVDTASLSRIRCFSGDWVRLETAAEPPANGIGAWGLGSFAPEQDESTWRPVKVFGLPEGYSQPKTTKVISSKQQGSRKMSFLRSQMQKPSSPVAYVSPILLANLENTPYCRISLLKQAQNSMKASQPKLTGSSRPPFAQELHLLKILTPLSLERTLQNALFTGLKKHFMRRTRIIRNGDIVAIPIDEGLGRSLYQPGSSDEDVDESLSKLDLDGPSLNSFIKTTGVGWFRISFIDLAKELTDVAEVDVWGGCASVDASFTKIKQSGGECSLIPRTMSNSWEYYLGFKSISALYPESTLMPKPRKPHVITLQRRLRELIAAAMSPRAVHLKLQPLAILLVSTHRNIGKATLATRACAELGAHTFVIDAYDIVSEGGNSSDIKTAGILEARAEKAMTCGAQFCCLMIRHIEALTADRMVATLKGILVGVRVLIATTCEVNKIPGGVRGLFSHEFEMNAPDESDREGLLRSILDNQPVALAPDIELGAVAVKTAALVAGDLVDVVDRALAARNARLQALASSPTTSDYLVTIRDVLVAGGPYSRCLTKADFDVAVEAARKNFANAIGAPKIPNVSWDDVGGLTNVKDAVMETIQLPLERPELFAKGMKKRSGILFYGPPGTGKTLLAKAIATEFSLNFFSVKGPELLNMYIGESEANVRRVFQRARDARPCVVFFDELDSVAPKRGNQGDSGGVMDRIVSQLLAELDGMSDGEDGSGGVFVIGATNRPDLLDAALLRPGRFDKMLYLGVSDTHEKQLTIMEALTRKFTIHPSLSLQRVASGLPFTYTGADFYALCSDAMLKAVTRQASLVDTKIKEFNATSGKPKISTAYFFGHYATKEDIAVIVTEGDFINAEKDLVPSVSTKELEHYKRVRAQFEHVEKKLSSLESDLKGKGKATETLHNFSNPRADVNGKGEAVDRRGNVREHSEEGMLAADGDDQFGNRLGVNGNSIKSDVKGKGKARQLDFQDGAMDDEEGLY